MAEIRPFPGVRYKLDRADAANDVVAPPYDVISAPEAQALRDRSPHNVVRLELPEDRPSDNNAENRYTRAAGLFREWLDSGVLGREAEPCLYVYGQRYEAGGERRERLGLLGALRVEPFEAGVVIPHEQTFPKHKEDRYRLLSTARAQFSPIFGLYSAPGAGIRGRLAECAARPPVAAATDRDGVEHRLWAALDPAFSEWAATTLRDRQVFIADGHHRYETALRWRNERRSAQPGGPATAADYVMTFLVEMEDPGLVVFPTHRLLRAPVPALPELRSALERYFRVEEVATGQVDAVSHHQIGVLFSGGTAWRLTLQDSEALDRLDREHSAAWRDLDVVLLHRLVLQEVLGLPEHADITYSRDANESREQVLEGTFAAGFFLPTPTVEELKAVAGAGDRMPEKSTYFWPKAITGLVIYEQ